MSNQELSESNQMPAPERGMQPLQSRLQVSLQYRLSHRPEGKDGGLAPSAEITDETPETDPQPPHEGLVCDAPLGLKQ